MKKQKKAQHEFWCDVTFYTMSHFDLNTSQFPSSDITAGLHGGCVVHTGQTACSPHKIPPDGCDRKVILCDSTKPLAVTTAGLDQSVNKPLHNSALMRQRQYK